MVYYFNKFTIVCKYMIFNQNCNNLNTKYYEELLKSILKTLEIISKNLKYIIMF